MGREIDEVEEEGQVLTLQSVIMRATERGGSNVALPSAPLGPLSSVGTQLTQGRGREEEKEKREREREKEGKKQRGEGEGMKGRGVREVVVRFTVNTTCHDIVVVQTALEKMASSQFLTLGMNDSSQLHTWPVLPQSILLLPMSLKFLLSDITSYNSKASL